MTDISTKGALTIRRGDVLDKNGDRLIISCGFSLGHTDLATAIAKAEGRS